MEVRHDHSTRLLSYNILNFCFIHDYEEGADASSRCWGRGESRCAFVMGSGGVNEMDRHCGPDLAMENATTTETWKRATTQLRSGSGFVTEGVHRSDSRP